MSRSPSTDPPPSMETLERAYGEGAVERRQAVLDALRGHFSPREGEPRALLVRALGDREWRVRREAMQLASAWILDPGGEALQADLVEAVAQGDNVGLRNAALEVLASRGPEVREALEGALEGAGQGPAAKFFVEALGATGDRAAVSKLVPLVAAEDANLSAAAVGALAQLGGAEAEQALLTGLAKDDPFRQTAALDGLAQLGARVPFAVLAPLVEDRFVRRAAVPLLGRSGSPKAAEILVEVLRSTGSRETLAKVAAVLVELGEEIGDAALEPHLADVRERLRRLAAEGEIPGRRAAAHLLTLARDEASLMEITALAAEDALLPRTLGALEDWGPEAVVPLLHIVQSTVGLQRCRALELAAALASGDPPAQLLEALREAAASSEASLRATALRSFAPHAREGDIDWLLDATRRDEATARAALACLEVVAERAPDALADRLRGMSFDGEGARLAKLAATVLGEEVLDELQAGLSSQRAAFRAAAVEALGRIARPRAAEMVAFALMDEDGRVRETAARVLGGLRGPEGQAVGVEALVAALGSEDDALRATAAAALGNAGGRGDETVVLALVDAARHGGPLTMAAALGSLERIAPSALEGLLDEALENPEAAVAERAMSVAASLGGDAAIRRLGLGLEHPVWHVRAAAARALGERLSGDGRELLLARRAVEDDPTVRAAIDEALEPRGR